MKLNKSKHCLNCHNEINESNYCPNCGQLNSDKKLSLRQILKDFLGDYFTFDSKFFKSLVPLLIKPGYLTREYINGKRTRYIFPLRLYVFTTFLFFFVVTLNTKLDFDKFTNTDNDSVKVGTTIIDSNMVSNDEFDTQFQKKLKEDITYALDSSSNGKKVKVKGPGFGFSFDENDTTQSAFVQYINNKAKYLANLGEEGSSRFWKEVINQLPKVMFILLPVFAFILKLIYIRRKILYVEHLVFALHIHTFIFIVLIVAAFISNSYVIFGLILLILLYIFFSQLNFYRQSKRKSIFKFSLLMMFYLFALAPSFGLLAFLAFVSV